MEDKKKLHQAKADELEAHLDSFTALLQAQGGITSAATESHQQKLQELSQQAADLQGRIALRSPSRYPQLCNTGFGALLR